jgi:hypothetical protein
VTLRRRAFVCVVLLALLTVTCVHFDSSGDRRYPKPDLMVTDYEEQVGKTTLIFGRVVDIEGDDLRVRVRTDAGPIVLTVPDTDVQMEPGGHVGVYGRISPQQTLVAKNVVVVNRTPDSERYKYLVSAIGAVLIVGLFFRRWTIDREQLAFTPREGTDG